eukprot:SAG25_NODE_3158_length_1191_cov_2.714286_1_plen_167_part_00
MSMNGLPNPGSAAKLLVCQRSRAPKVVVARTVPNSAVDQLFFSAVLPLIDLCAGHTKLHVRRSYEIARVRRSYEIARAPVIRNCTGRSNPERRPAELGLANGDNLRNSFALVTGNSPDVIPPTGIFQGHIRAPGRSSESSVSPCVTRPVTPFLLGLSPHPRAIIAI